MAGVGETSAAAVAQQLLHPLDRPADHAARLAGSELALNLEKGSVGAIERLGKDRGDVEGDGRITGKQRRRVGNVELRLLQGSYVRRMGLIQEDGQFAEHRAGRRDFGDLHSILDDLYGTAPEDKQPSRRGTGGQNSLLGLVFHHGQVREPLLEGRGVRN
jgi:hypothetical protein